MRAYPHMQRVHHPAIYICRLLLKPVPTLMAIASGVIGAALYAPVSRGLVTLASADPYKLPSVDFRLLEAP